MIMEPVSHHGESVLFLFHFSPLSGIYIKKHAEKQKNCEKHLASLSFYSNFARNKF